MNNHLVNKISGNDNVSATEVGVLILVLMITFKTCNLPSVLFATSGESGVWSIAIHLILDAMLLVFALYIASKGGIQSKNIPKPLRKCAAFILFLFFLFKFSAFTFEAASSAVSVLFERAQVVPILIAIVMVSAIMASKGFTGISRTALLFGWLAIFILLFNLFFIGFDGFGFNLYPVFKFNKVPDGILKEAAWFGEPLIFLTTDFSKKTAKKQKGFIIFTFIISAITLIGFYLLLIFTYGSLADSVNNAFSRVLTMNKYSNELGAVDWPMIILWLVMAIIHLSCLVCATRQCFIEVADTNKQNKLVKEIAFYSIVIIAPAIFYFFVFDSVNYSKILSDKAVGLITLIVSYTLPLAIAVSLWIKNKKIIPKSVDGKNKITFDKD